MRRSSLHAPLFFNTTRHLEGIVLIVQDGVKDHSFSVNKTKDFIRLDGLDNLVRKAKQSTKPGKQVHTSRLLSSGVQWML